MSVQSPSDRSITASYSRAGAYRLRPRACSSIAGGSADVGRDSILFRQAAQIKNARLWGRKFFETAGVVSLRPLTSLKRCPLSTEQVVDSLPRRAGTLCISSRDLYAKPSSGKVPRVGDGPFFLYEQWFSFPIPFKIHLSNPLFKDYKVWSDAWCVGMKNKNTHWTSDEEAALAEAVEDKISPLRLSVRLQRSEASIKRRMRELGLAGTRRGPRKLVGPSFNIQVEAYRWLETCRSRDLFRLLDFYGPEATLECLCTGAAVYGGHLAIQQYWASKLRSTHPLAFTMSGMKGEGERIVIDYLSYEAKPVRMFLSFDMGGKIVHSRCGPAECKSRSSC